MSLLSVRNLSVAYGPVRATRDVTFGVGEGEILALIGSNGAGKSSTLKAIMGLSPIVGGDVSLMNVALGGLTCPEILRRGIALSPEGRRVFAGVSVEDNLRAGAYTRSRAEMNARLAEMYQIFPILEARARQSAGSLSGGQQQMLAISRALMSHPKVLLLDEPSLGLAPLILEKIGEVIHQIRRMGVAIVLAEQNAHWAVSLATHVLVMENGHQVMYDSADQALANDEIVHAYLGG